MRMMLTLFRKCDFFYPRFENANSPTHVLNYLPPRPPWTCSFHSGQKRDVPRVQPSNCLQNPLDTPVTSQSPVVCVLVTRWVGVTRKYWDTRIVIASIHGNPMWKRRSDCIREGEREIPRVEDNRTPYGNIFEYDIDLQYWVLSSARISVPKSTI